LAEALGHDANDPANHRLRRPVTCPRRRLASIRGSGGVEWIDGLVTPDRRDPRAHLRLESDPKHLHRHV
jgi:hypothetical protein